MLNKEKTIVSILSTKKINMLKMIKEINMKGLSAPSLYNKMNPNIKNIRFKDSELEAIENYLTSLFKEGLNKLKK